MSSQRSSHLPAFLPLCLLAFPQLPFFLRYCLRRFRLQHRDDRIEDFACLRHASRPDAATGEPSLTRPDKLESKLGQRGDIALNDGVGPHADSFIAGASTTGEPALITRVLTRSSAMPPAIFPMMFAVAGAISKRSAASVTVTCCTPAASCACHRFVSTGRPLSALEADGADKPPGRLRHRDGHARPPLRQCGDDLTDFVGRDPTANTDEHFMTRQVGSLTLVRLARHPPIRLRGAPYRASHRGFP